MADTPAAQDGEAGGGKKTILLVEDDAFLAEIYSTRLGAAGFTVRNARDGEEALQLAEQLNPHLILLDLVLPKRNGFSVLEALKKEKATRDIPVVILSNLGEPHDIERGKELGAAGYIVKAHFTPTEVFEEVKRILNQQNLQS